MSPRKLAILSSAAALGLLAFRACSSRPEDAYVPAHQRKAARSTAPAEEESPAPDAPPAETSGLEPARRQDDYVIDPSRKYGGGGPPPQPASEETSAPAKP